MIDPEEMSAMEWTDRMSLELPRILPMKINHESEWRDWAYHVIQDPSISRRHPPDPGTYADWREWADRFNETVFE
jgi:hypothetical protein